MKKTLYMQETCACSMMSLDSSSNAVHRRMQAIGWIYIYIYMYFDAHRDIEYTGQWLLGGSSSWFIMGDRHIPK